MQTRQKRINKTISLAASTHDLLDRYSTQLEVPASRIIESLISQHIYSLLDDRKYQELKK